MNLAVQSSSAGVPPAADPRSSSAARAVRTRGDTGTVSSSYWDFLQPPPPDPSRAPLRVSVRTFGQAVEEALMSYTRVKLETILEDELALEWQLDFPPVEAHTKRDLIQGYTTGWKVAQLAGLPSLSGCSETARSPGSTVEGGDRRRFDEQQQSSSSRSR